jgi:hypothetical protein
MQTEPGPAKRFKRKLRQGSPAEGRTQEFAAQLPGTSEELQSQCSLTQCLGGCRGKGSHKEGPKVVG